MGRLEEIEKAWEEAKGIPHEQQQWWFGCGPWLISRVRELEGLLAVERQHVEELSEDVKRFRSRVRESEKSIMIRDQALTGIWQLSKGVRDGKA